MVSLCSPERAKSYQRWVEPIVIRKVTFVLLHTTYSSGGFFFLSAAPDCWAIKFLMLWKLKEMEYVEKIADKISNISVSGNGVLIEQLKQIFVPQK